MTNMTTLEREAYDVGLRVATYNAGGGATHYRFFREDRIDVGGTYDYFGGSDSNKLITVSGRKAAYAFIEAYRFGRRAGIREAAGIVSHGADADQSSEQVAIEIDHLIDRGPWHFGGEALDARKRGEAFAGFVN